MLILFGMTESHVSLEAFLFLVYYSFPLPNQERILVESSELSMPFHCVWRLWSRTSPIVQPCREGTSCTSSLVSIPSQGRWAGCRALTAVEYTTFLALIYENIHRETVRRADRSARWYDRSFTILARAHQTPARGAMYANICPVATAARVLTGSASESVGCTQVQRLEMSPDIEAIRACQGHGSCSSSSARRRCYSAARLGSKWDQLSRKEPLE